ncbi:MAG: hypothetical protein K6A40_01675 [Solobacterium sp.]|nr:hypothetical protein [Solobacterium sp.]
MNNTWSMIWHQAMTRSFLNGKGFGWNKTIVFSVSSPVSGSQIRLRFSNRYGNEPYEISALSIQSARHFRSVTLNHRTAFQIQKGITYSDPCAIPVQAGEVITIRMYYTSAVLDSNMIEQEANLLNGDHTRDTATVKMQKPLPAKLLGVYNAIPAIEAVEVLTEEPLKAIAAFGDSITALSQWTKPLAKRLEEAYPGEYVLLNSGISGNCLLYEPKGVFGPVFGDRGTVRFERDVLAIPDLSEVIIALGVNDVSYLNDETRDLITLENYQKAVTDLTVQLHEQGVRVIMETITPRLGVARTMGKYTREMEELRLQCNAWIRNTDIFEYVFDAEAVVREERKDGYYFAEGLHMGDHLHPNKEGGQKLADAFDVKKLTGKE